jgi:hypothetical protein
MVPSCVLHEDPYQALYLAFHSHPTGRLLDHIMTLDVGYPIHCLLVLKKSRS